MNTNRFSALSIDDNESSTLSLPKTKVPMAGIPKRVPMAYTPPHLRNQQQQQTQKPKTEFPSLGLQRSSIPSPTKPAITFAEKVKVEMPKPIPNPNPKSELPSVEKSIVSTPSPFWKNSNKESFNRYSPEHEYEEDHYSGEDLDHDVYGQTYNYSKSSKYTTYDEELSGESELEEDDNDY
jgi:hypothetical protein